MALLPTTVPPRSSSLRPSMQSLMENVQTFVIKNPRQSQQNLGMDRPFEPVEYTSRKAALEVCTVAICPAFPEYMIIGTYALVKKDESSETAHQIRKGTLSIMTVATPFKPAYPGMLPPFLDTKFFPCAILDIHFHPNDDTLLGVATSNAAIHFFRLIKHASVIDRRVELRLIPVGSVKVAEDDQHGLVHLITQFAWLPAIEPAGKEGVNDELILALAATESSGNVKLVKAAIPGVKTHFDKRIEILSSFPPPQISSTYLRKHDQEAWTVATFSIPAPEGQHNRILLSGGDDSALRASLISLHVSTTSLRLDDHLTILSTPPINRWIDRRSHAAGVTAILSLPPLLVTSSPLQPSTFQTTIPVLTGSYDESIRVYTVDPVTTKQVLHAELPLGGGVWRLALMDSYAHHDDDEMPLPGQEIAEGHTHKHKHSYIILASCMHTGVRILRVTYHHHPSPSTGFPSLRPPSHPWTINPLVHFNSPHSSMVYSCDFRADDDAGAYTVVSTSFYDMRVCVWGWRDGVRERKRERESEREGNGDGGVEIGLGLGRSREGSAGAGAGAGVSTSAEKGKEKEAEVSGWVMERGEWKMR